MNEVTANRDEAGNPPSLEPFNGDRISPRQVIAEVILLVLLFFVYSGDAPPMINEAHYLVKAKNFWDPQWCSSDLFASSGKAHTTFYALFGWPTKWVSLESTAWMGRIVGWSMIAFGLQQLCWNLFHRRYVCLAVAAVWIAGIEHGNLAGEWVIGGIEAKVPAYGLILLALSQLIQRHWNRVWILLGAASAFHVLSGGWSVIAASVAWWFTERGRDDRRPMLTPSLLIGGAIALFGLVPALTLTMGAGAEDSLAAAWIYTYYRLKHHLLPADFLPAWYIRHGVLLLALLVLAIVPSRGYDRPDDRDRFRRVGWFTVGTLSISIAGLIVGILPSVAPDLAAKLLRYYWFRLSDAIVPLMFALVVGRGLLAHRRLIQPIAVAFVVLAVGLVSLSSYRRARVGVPPSISSEVLGFNVGASSDQQRRVFRDWMAVCRWARASTQPDEVFLTPRHQQTFKWYSDRSEVVNWKDVPQDAASLRKWYERFREIFPARLGHVRVTIQYSKLVEYRERYGVNYLIVDRRIAGRNLPLVKLYPSANESNETYAVYELPANSP